MNIDKLKEEQKQLEQQREQLIAQLNQVVGALAWVEKSIKEESEPIVKEKIKDESELKQTA
jgi:hypothetical protein